MKKLSWWSQLLIFFGIKKPPVISAPQKPVEQPPVIVTPEPPVTQPNVEKKWSDKRPIGMIQLASAPGEGDIIDHTNLRWKIGGKIGEISPDLLQKFGEECLVQCKKMDAQGVVVWDPEGQSHPHPFSYLGDPRQVPASVLPLIDSFFKVFTSKGYKVGICIRPDKVEWIGGYPHHISAYDPVQEMIDKINYAHNRWGCTMFYIDSNIWPDEGGGINMTKDAATIQTGFKKMDASAIEKVAKKFPSFLFMPEHQDIREFEYSAPYNDKHFRASIAIEQQQFPNAFQVLMPAESSFTQQDLNTAVKEGSILMFRAWFNDPWNDKIKQAYA